MSHKNSIALRKINQPFLMNQSGSRTCRWQGSVYHLKVVLEDNRRNFRDERENW